MMKKVVFALTVSLSLMILTFLLTNCGSDIPEDLLKHSIHKEEINDVPIKTGVILKVLIEDKEMDEQKVRDLLNHLFDKTLRRSGFKYHDHPTNIGIYAYTSKDKAESGGAQWIGMIINNSTNEKSEIYFNEAQFSGLTEVTEDKWGLTYKQRQEVWVKVIHLERKAQKEADKEHPMDKPGITKEDMIKNVDLLNELTEKYENELAKEYGVEIAFIDSVGLEGLENGWAFPE